MPELPEVESTVTFLRERIEGLGIKEVHVNWARLVAKITPQEFKDRIRGSRITKLFRRGKYVVMTLHSNGSEQFLFGHMRMSGSFDVVSKDSARSKHDHVIFELDCEKEVRFHDPRKFGRFHLVTDAEEITNGLGLEPLDPKLTWVDFAEKLKKRKTKIKAALLDQSLIAGVGNIYADESLWYAKINPQKKTGRIKDKEFTLLFRSLQKVLWRAIETNGTDNGDGVVEGGLYSPKAYGRAGAKCYRCKKLLRRIIVAQRGTSYCHHCQR